LKRGGFSKNFQKISVGGVDVPLKVGSVSFFCGGECGVFHGFNLADCPLNVKDFLEILWWVCG
jgi:hypothetical protein